MTSVGCRACHPDKYASWHEKTLHPYMFLPVDHPDAEILADFSLNSPLVTFGKTDIEYVIGSKWEQLYVRMIEGEYYLFPAKWYVIKKQWVPYKVNTWRETPLSYHCNGCHTTGFDPNTLKFSEFGIGCEACHGPGSKHISYRQKKEQFFCILCHGRREEKNSGYQYIIKDFSASVCGQCHNRGITTSGEVVKSIQFNFPVDYQPGTDLRASQFKMSTPDSDPGNKNWWGNGLSKNRHQELNDWKNSAHARSLANMIAGQSENPEGCGRTEASCLYCHSDDFRLAGKNEKPDVYNVRLGISCTGCHDPHGRTYLRKGDSVLRITCVSCHTGMQDERGSDHHPCSAAEVKCADCHMPHIVKTGGFFSLSSHALKIVPPSVDNGDMPNSCQNGGCHSDKTLEWAVRTYDLYYKTEGGGNE